jgi:demethylmenaquinone methyltransferase/2-methoxy-6-polyprenyl-1,4-benzoquinol methylase
LTDDSILREQAAYYRARAGEYDEWFLREGRYDRGAGHRAEWFGEIDTIRRLLATSIRGMDVLELACGTGLWTGQLARDNRRVFAVDASPEVLAINQRRVGGHSVQYEAADIFSWTPPARFDAVFFAFWLSHVPPDRFDRFWATVAAALKPDGLVFFIDSLMEPASTAIDHVIDDSGVVCRRLNDGREFHVVKVFYEPQQLEARLAHLGWPGRVRSSGRFFLHGLVTRST